MACLLIRTSTAILCVFSAFTLHGQNNAIKALQKIHNSYNSRTAIRFTGNITMYVKSQPSRITDQLSCSYTLQNDKFLCSIGSVLMLLNDKYYVSVDKKDKLIMLGRRKNLPAMAGNPVLDLSRLEKWMTEKKIQASVSAAGDNAQLQLTDIAAISGFNAYTIEFNTHTGYMKRVLIEAHAGNKTSEVTVLDIRYSMPRAAADAQFSEKDFFSITGDKVLVASPYRNYQLINQL